ncbi:MAG: hypothetical protein CMH46_02325 [Muricauda sp.]|nr:MULTISPECIES: hypothetical protein [unclassified Allomuricauda]MAU14358.1 hypothetical protein [Allomuricauda sp.]|tara:strand:- start:1549 stop:2544 length:996 start_codon:yes stop_codon:yes gene_type:complete
MITKSKILNIIGVLIIASAALSIIFILGKNDKILETKVKRELGELKFIESINTGKKVSLVKQFNDSIYFISWSKSGQGKLFQLSNNKEIDFNRYTDSLLIGDYFISKNNTFTIYNKLKNDLLQINSDDKLLYKSNAPIRLSRLFKKDYIYFITDWDENYRFRRFKFNFEDNDLEQLEFNDSYLNEYELSGIALDGFFYHNDDYILNLPFSLNCAYLYDKDFNLIKRIDFIYKKNEFNYQVTPEGQLILDSNNIHPNLSGAVDASNLYVLIDAGTTSKNNYNFLIDVYNIESGEYIRSYEIEKYRGDKPSYFVIKNSQLYLSFGSYINKYQL